jgi:hypothetical protein
MYREEKKKGKKLKPYHVINTRKEPFLLVTRINFCGDFKSAVRQTLLTHARSRGRHAALRKDV